MIRHHASDDEPDCDVPLLADHDYYGPKDNAQSPAVSAISSQSQEVKYIFQPCSSQAESDEDSFSDYSHINIKSKVPHSHDGNVSGRPPPYNRYERKSTTRFQYSFQAGIASANTSKFCPQPQTVSLEDVSKFDSSQRNSWSPTFSWTNADGYQNAQGGAGEWESHQIGSEAYDQQGHHQDEQQNQLKGYAQSGLESRVQVQLGLHSRSHGRLNSDDAEDGLPPRLAPISGVLSEKLSKNLIRPVAFKPSSSQSSVNTCQLCEKEECLCGCVMSPSHFQNSDLAYPESARAYSVSRHIQPSFLSAVDNNCRYLDYDRETACSDEDSPRGNVDQGLAQGISGEGLESPVQTPSPSDSGVGELEAMLKEREAEILTLRQVMDRNERAIFQVYEEKKSQWLQEMREIKEEYEYKLKVQQQKANKLEQALAMQIHRLQQEKLQLAGKYTDLYTEKDFAHKLNPSQAYSSEVENTSACITSSQMLKKMSPSIHSSSGGVRQQPTLQNEIARKKSEIMDLRSELKVLQNHLEEKNQQLVQMHNNVSSKTVELKSVHEQLDQLSGVDQGSLCEDFTQTSVSDTVVSDRGVVRPADMSDEEYTQALERQVDALQDQVQEAQILVETERVQWVEEKNKVIRYQKQLQLNYIQMQRKNVALEAEVEQLTLELESRELKLTALNGEESVC